MVCDSSGFRHPRQGSGRRHLGGRGCRCPRRRTLPCRMEGRRRRQPVGRGCRCRVAGRCRAVWRGGGGVNRSVGVAHAPSRDAAVPYGGAEAASTGRSGLPMPRRRTFAAGIHALRSLRGNCASPSWLRWFPRPALGAWATPTMRAFSKCFGGALGVLWGCFECPCFSWPVAAGLQLAESGSDSSPAWVLQ